MRNGVIAGILALAAGAAGSGCAGVVYGPAGPDVPGLRYHPPATYLLVTPDYRNQTATVTVHHLPDTSRTFAAQPYAVLARNDTALTFRHGMLARVSSDAEGARFVAQTLAAAAAVGEQMLETAKESEDLAVAVGKALGAARLATPEARAAAAGAEPPVFLFLVGEAGLTQVFPPVAGAGVGR